jgi:hypothetical protein
MYDIKDSDFMSDWDEEKDFWFDYDMLEIEKNAKKSKKKQNDGCYVATCVYGSYDCPEVWTLRRFRDYKLKQNFIGRAFIKFYYAVSPTIVKIFGNTKWFKNIWRSVLDKMVYKLQIDGFDDTPYDDFNYYG